MKLTKTLWLAAALIFTSYSWQAMADSSSASASAPANSSSSSIFSKVKENIKFTYINELYGMNSKSLSGNLDGSGRNLTMNHYESLGYKLGKGWSVAGTAVFRQHIDENPDTQTFEKRDPYFTVSNAALFNNERYGTSLYFFARYYAPFSRATKRGVNSRTDAANGLVRIALNPSKTWLDGKITTTLGTSTYIRFAKNAPAVHENYFFYLNPSVSYSVSSKLEAYLEWNTGYLRHTTDGKWTSMKDASGGGYLSPGVNWMPTKKITINPYISWSEPVYQIKNTDIGITSIFSIL